MSEDPIKDVKRVIKVLEENFCRNCKEFYNVGGDMRTGCCDIDLDSCDVRASIDMLSSDEVYQQ